MKKIQRLKFRTQYTAAQAFQQIRLDQYLTNITNVGGGGVTFPGGYGGGPFSIPTPGAPGTVPPPSLSKLILLEPTTLGIVYTENLGASSHWTQINTTLISSQYLGITRMFVTPNGAFYVANDNGTDAAFLARAPAVGGDFVEIFNKAVADDYFGIGTMNSLQILSLAYNPLLPEEVIFIGGNSNGNKFFRVTPDGNIELIKTLMGGLLAGGNSHTFGDDKFFMAIGDGHAFNFPLDYSVITSLGTISGIAFSEHARAGVIGTVVMPYGSGNLRISLDNGATYVDITGLGLGYSSADGVRFLYKLVLNNDGTQILTHKTDLLQTVISKDGGNSFAQVTGLSGGATWTYAFAGGDTVDTRWIATGDNKVFYNEKSTDGDWLDVTGDLIMTGSARCVLPIADDTNPIIPISATDMANAAQQFNQGYTAPAAVSTAIEDTITNGVTDKAPSENAVFDALALKEDLANKKTTMTGNTTSNVFYLTAKAIYDWAVGLFSQLGHTHATYLTDAPVDGSIYGRKDADWAEINTGSGSIVALMRWTSGGGTTFDLPDVAESLTNLFDNGTLVDPLVYSLSSDCTQVITDSAITSGHVVIADYVVAQ